MKRFRSYLEESLDSGVPYWLLDESRPPKQFYVAFNVNGGSYVAALVQSKTPGVYYMEMGRTKQEGGKVTWWRFHNEKDIMPALSTLVDFSRDTMLVFGQSKFKGVAIKIRATVAKKSIDRAIRVASRVVKTKFKSHFKLINVNQEGSESKYGNKYIFLAGKTQTPEKLFSKEKNFSGYDFSNSNEIDFDALEQIEPQKMIKKTVKTLKPSEKYTFKKFDVDTPDSLDDDQIKKLSNLKSIDPSAEDKKKKESKYDLFKKELNNLVDLKVGEDGPVNYASILSGIPEFKSMKKSIWEKGFDKDKLNWDNLSYVVKQASPKAKELLNAMGMDTVDEVNKAKWIQVLQNMNKVDTGKMVDTINFLEKYPEVPSKEEKVKKDTSGKIVTRKVSEINPTELISTVPGSVNSDVNININGDWGKSTWGLNEDKGKKVNYIYTDLGYGEELPKLPGYKQMYAYTGSSFSDYNSTLRSVVTKFMKGEKLSAYELDKVLKGTSSIEKLFKMFDKVTPLPEGIWVYRGTGIPKDIKQDLEPGSQFTDPAFMSTSINENISFGDDRLRIFLPKGSKVLPALYNSKHSNEAEIILPPSSIIKVIETTYVEGPYSNTLYIQGIFMGSAHKSIKDVLKKQLTMAEGNITIRQALEMIRMNEMTENQKNKSDQDYNPEDKFGGAYDYNLGELINNQIKSGKLKVDGPVKNEK